MDIKFFSGQANIDLAKDIINSYNNITNNNIKIGDSRLITFSDGEFIPIINETVRGKTIFIIQSTFPPVDNIFELMLMADAAKRASAKQIIAVIPYFGFARQDRKDKPRVPIGAKMVADILKTSGIDRVITMDLHADQIQGFFNMPVDHIYGSTLFIPYIKDLGLSDLIIATPDVGGAKRALVYSNHLNCNMVMAHKERKKENNIENMIIIGDVNNKNVIIVDDMIDTAGTVCKASQIMMEKGAKSVRVVATHPIMSGPAYERINESPIIEVITSNSIPTKESNKIKVLSIGNLFGDVINKLYKNNSISEDFIN